MARTHIGNKHRHAPATVSRVLKRFQDEKLLVIDRREVEISDMARLEALAAPLMGG